MGVNRNGKRPVRLLIADDHTIFREALKSILTEINGFEVAGEAASGKEAVRLSAALAPDVVILDWILPDMQGMEAVKGIRLSNPATGIIILTIGDDLPPSRELKKAGAGGCVLKEEGLESLVRAVRAVAAGKTWYHPVNTVKPATEKKSHKS